MKKLIFILVLLLNGIALNAQTTPTKQETVDWIADKINAYGKGYGDGKSPYVKHGVIHDYPSNIDADLNDVTSFEVHYRGIILYSKDAKFIQFDNIPRIRRYVGRIVFEFDSQGETNLMDRINTALQQLVKYNRPPTTVKDIY